MIVLREGAEMLGQALDSLCQQSDLDLRRSCVILRSGVVRHDAFLGFPRQGHPFLQRSSSLSFVSSLTGVRFLRVFGHPESRALITSVAVTSDGAERRATETAWPL